MMNKKIITTIISSDVSNRINYQNSEYFKCMHCRSYEFKLDGTEQVDNGSNRPESTLFFAKCLNCGNSYTVENRNWIRMPKNKRDKKNEKRICNC